MLSLRIIVPNIKSISLQYKSIYTYFITTEDTESTEELRPYLLNFLFFLLYVVTLSLEIGDETLALDYEFL